MDSDTNEFEGWSYPIPGGMDRDGVSYVCVVEEHFKAYLSSVEIIQRLLAKLAEQAKLAREIHPFLIGLQGYLEIAMPHSGALPLVKDWLARYKATEGAR